jgi:acetate kinase
MGLTPLEGLMMGTRSGNVDPALVGHLMRRAELSIEQVEVYLTARSGLLGVSGLSHDTRTLLEAEKQGDERAALAIEMFCYRVRQYVGAYLAILGGAQAVVFGGGIGENAPEVRARICGGMNWCGLELDQERNNQAVGCESLVSTESSAIKVFVVPVNEERLILRDILGSL